MAGHRFPTTLAVFSIILCALSLVPARTWAQSLGFTPSSIELKNGLRGQQYEITTTLVNQTDDPRIFSLRAAGAIGGWIEFAEPSAPGTSIDAMTVPAGSKVALLVRIAVPETAANGEYHGVNQYDGYTEETYRDRKGVVFAFEQRVAIKVTGDQFLDLRVGDVSARDIEAGQLLQVRTQLTNNGNVDTQAEIALSFFRADEGTGTTGSPLDEVRSKLEPVRPGKSTTAETGWETSGQRPGNYLATYSVTLQGERLKSGSFEFSILASGSLAREGRITAIQIVRPINPGGMSRADVTFRNEGEVASRARFQGEVLQEGVAIAAAESPAELLVRPGEEVVLSAFFELAPDANGEFELHGRVQFEGAETEEASLAFSVGGDGEPSLALQLWLGGVGAFALGASTLGGAWMLRRRRVV
jgi:hypothetical protein